MEFQKFQLEKNITNEGNSIERVDELNDGRLLVSGGLGSLSIYNISDSDFWKKEVSLFLGYIVSYKQLKSGNIVACNYQGLMGFFNLKGDIVQSIKYEQSERENFIDELSNGQLIAFDFYGKTSLYDNINGQYKRVKSFQKIKNFQTHSVIELNNGKIVLHGWNISTKDYPAFLFDLNNLTFRTIKDNCISVDLMENGNLVIFTEETVEIFNIENFNTLSVLKVPDNFKIKCSCLYDNHTIFLGNENKEVYEFLIKDNQLVQVDKFNVKCELRDYVDQIIKLKNGKVIFIACTEVYLYKPI